MIAPSGDGATIWIACQNPPPAPPASKHFAATTIYALHVKSGGLQEVARASGASRIVPAPVGDQAIVVLTGVDGRDEPTLFQANRRVAKLPIDSWNFAWSPDAKRIFFYAGSTTEQEAWNILGVLTLSNMAVVKHTLLEPTEEFHVCAATGHVYTGFARRDRDGRLKGRSVVEYDADMQHPIRVERHPPGMFSATCQYVSTMGFFHGPVPWSIFEVAGGREVLHFDLTGEGKKDEFELLSWNPQLEHVFLRYRYPGGESEVTVEAFDMLRQKVLTSMEADRNEVAWSRDGQSLWIAQGNALILRPIATFQ